MPPFGSRCPSLYQFEHLGPHLQVDGSWSGGFQERDKIIHEFPGGDLGEEMGAAILDAGICKLAPCQQDRLWKVFMADWPTSKALSWVLGFLFPMRLLRDRMASLG